MDNCVVLIIPNAALSLIAANAIQISYMQLMCWKSKPYGDWIFQAGIQPLVRSPSRRGEQHSRPFNPGCLGVNLRHGGFTKRQSLLTKK